MSSRFLRKLVNDGMLKILKLKTSSSEDYIMQLQLDKTEVTFLSNAAK